MDESLKGMIAWVPMVKGDSALEAAELVSPDERFILQSWDAKLSVSEAFAKTLKLNGPAWDVYLIYQPGVQWIGENPPVPSFWMHQLEKTSGADPTLHLRPAKLQRELRNALRTTGCK